MTAFRECLDACSLMDMDSKECVFTWANNKEGEEYVKERLDRVVCTIEWWLMYPKAKAYALPAIGLDHSPIILSLQTNHARRKRVFRFEAFWLKSAECKEVVLKSWETTNQHKTYLVGKLHPIQNALEQSAFVGGRQIQDNIFIVQEVLHQIRIRSRKKEIPSGS